ncbi:MAG: exodeoxyribonuclease VII small subunit [Defluviitaleaceae bacterium]|nr:exodeoxyribonuclease VII small subunit [Defluviitaleaceae bacterium]
MPRKKNLSFEEKITRLAEIIEEVDSDQTPLDNALTLYKEGLELATSCGQFLTEYETQVQSLQKAADNTFSLQPFDHSNNM